MTLGNRLLTTILFAVVLIAFAAAMRTAMLHRTAEMLIDEVYEGR